MKTKTSKESNLHPSLVRYAEKNIQKKAKMLNNLPFCRLHIDISFLPCGDGLIYYKDFSAEDRLLYKSNADFHIFDFIDINIHKIKKTLIPLLQPGDCLLFHIDNTTNHDLVAKIMEEFESNEFSLGIALDIGSDSSVVSQYFGRIKKIIIMGIPRGTYGHPLAESAFIKYNDVKKRLQLGESGILIGLDGGISDKNVKEMKNMFDFVVIGGVLFSKEDLKVSWDKLHNA